MNCDEAFEHLTDSNLRDRPELRWHLELCPRCRQMKDILAPALPLFDNPPPEEADEEIELNFPEFEEDSLEDFLSESDYSEIFGSDAEGESEQESSTFSAWEMVHLADQAARRALPETEASEESVDFSEPPHRWMRYLGFFLLGGALVYGLFLLGESNRPEPRSRKDYCLWQHPELMKNYTTTQSASRSCIDCHQHYSAETEMIKINWKEPLQRK